MATNDHLIHCIIQLQQYVELQHHVMQSLQNNVHKLEDHVLSLVSDVRHVHMENTTLRAWMQAHEQSSSPVTIEGCLAQYPLMTHPLATFEHIEPKPP